MYVDKNEIKLYYMYIGYLNLNTYKKGDYKMTKKINKVTPENTEIRDYKQGFGFFGGGLSGTVFIDNVNVGTFISDGRNEGIDNIYIFDEKLKQQMIDYQKENEEDKFFQDVEGFLLKAINFHIIFHDVKNRIKNFSKKHNMDKLTVGSLLFVDSEQYMTSIFNEVYVKPSEDDLEVFKNQAIKHEYYSKDKAIYFIKYISARKIMVERLK